MSPFLICKPVVYLSKIKNSDFFFCFVRMTGLIAHGLTVAWGVFQVSRSGHNKFVYNSLVVGELCGGKDLLPEFWSIRMNFFVSPYNQHYCW